MIPQQQFESIKEYFFKFINSISFTRFFVCINFIMCLTILDVTEVGWYANFIIILSASGKLLYDRLFIIIEAPEAKVWTFYQFRERTIVYVCYFCHNFSIISNTLYHLKWLWILKLCSYLLSEWAEWNNNRLNVTIGTIKHLNITID